MAAKLFRALVCALTLLTAVLGSPVPSTPQHNITLDTRDISASLGAPGGGYRSVAYFTSWSVYERQHFPDQIPANDLTNVLYSFANVRSDGFVFYSDNYAELEKHYPGDTWADASDVYGNVKQFYKLKKQNRNLKVSLSIGGWSYSQDANSEHFPDAASTQASRDKFAASAVELLRDGGFDGLDIDWEYPRNDLEAGNYVLLLATIRNALDAYSAQYASGYHFLLTAAMPAGPEKYSTMHLKAMDDHLDFMNVMAYDFSGSWAIDTGADHQSNLYPDTEHPASTPYSVDRCITDYIAAGIAPGKLVLGLPIYGRSFENTDGPGSPFTGIGEKNHAAGSWENGVWEYKHLPRAGAHEIYDSKIGASYSYDPNTREMITYDNPEVLRQKAQYISDKSLGGAMFWETSADAAGAQGVIGTTVGSLGHNLEQSTNLLEYPQSQYHNIASGNV